MTQTLALAPAGITGAARHLGVSRLRLDPENPRFPVPDATGEQHLVAAHIAAHYNALEIAQRIAVDGFHATEPLGVTECPEEPGTYLALEGNRRLTALMGLTDPAVRAGFAQSEKWDALLVTAAARGVTLPTQIPVVVYPSRAAAQSFLAQRHVKGALKWEPLQQARWISERVDEGMSLAEVAEICGMRLSDVRDCYRNYHVTVTEAARLKVDVSKVADKFTVFCNALANKTLREHAGVVATNDVRAGAPVVSALLTDKERTHRLRETVRWVVGDATHRAVLQDSREVVKLAQVVADAQGLRLLRAGSQLRDVLQALSEAGADPLTSSTRMLGAANCSLRNVRVHLDRLSEEERTLVLDEQLPLLRAALAAVEAMRSEEE